MFLNIPWINNRKKIIFRILIDLFLFNIGLIFSLNNDINSINFIFLSNIIFIWITLSYVVGRYLYDFQINLISLLKYLVYTGYSLCFTYGIFFLEYLLFDDFLVGLSLYNLIKRIFLLSSISYGLQITYSIFANPKEYVIKKTIFIGSEENFKILEKLTKENKFSKLDFGNISNFNKSKFSNKYITKNYSSIIIDDEKYLSSKRFDILLSSLNKGIKILTKLDWFEFTQQKIPLEFIKTSDFLTKKISDPSFELQLRIKRIFDIFFGVILLVCTAPFLILIGILIKIEDGGPIFYSQWRSGIGAKPFKIIKLRTMKINAEENGPQWSKRNDSRVTFTGKILRRMRIDELPQIISVIKGDMSLIGPRPERPIIEKEIKDKIDFYNLKFLIKPGLSGWAQVNYPYGASLEDSKNKLTFDIYYIKNFSIWLDLLIFFKTIKLVINASGSIPKK